MPISTNRYTGGCQIVIALFSRILDVCIIYQSLIILRDYFQIEPINQPLYILPALLATIFYFFTSELFSFFYSKHLLSISEIVKRIITSWATVIIFLFLIALVTKTATNYSRLTMGTWFITCPLALIFSHFCIQIWLRNIYSQDKNQYSYAILGDSKHTKNLPQKISQLPWTGLRLAGLYESLPTLLSDLKTLRIDYVFLSYPSNEQDKILMATRALNDSTASVYLVPDLLLSDLLGSRWILLGNTPLIVINDHPFYGGRWVLKKIEDVVLSSLILILICPILILIGIAIKLTSPGSILFKQRRHGLNGEVISVLKFRTMTSSDDGDVVIQATKGDSRITSLGKFLRRYSLDELPQFFNVLQGSMSIVGPRPHALVHNEHYRKLIDGYMQRHKVKPGITGWAQVNGLRGETDTIEKMERRVEFDLYYINHWSIGFDLKIILLTIRNIFIDKAAY